MDKADVLILGSGGAALQLAGKLDAEKNVIIITKSFMDHGNTSLAQGGIAAAIDEKDNSLFHFMDTMTAGRFVNNHQAALQLTIEGPAVIRELIKSGCAFDHDAFGKLTLGKEGAHSLNRIVHGGGDQTGKILMNCLKTVLPPNVKVMEHHFAFELLINVSGHCYGVRTKDKQGNVQTFHASHIVLATGGCGQIYSCTSNAETATGDGMALAYFAGAELADMEYMQFHPTLLYINDEGKGLISEAVRGAGGILVDEKERRVMKNVHPLLDLAPRHVVSQTIFKQRQQGHEIFLDIRGIEHFTKKFPFIAKLCMSEGIDVSEGFIPVAPGCHFSMGGVKTDTVGRTTIKGLYAIGEVACTGVHGANRLASNSLLEGLVFAKTLAHHLNTTAPYSHKDDGIHKKNLPSDYTLPVRTHLQKRMMDKVGIFRDIDNLEAQQKWLESFSLNRWHTFDIGMLTTEQITTLFMLQTAWLVTNSAIQREESRGGHYRLDFPAERMDWRNQQVIQKRIDEKRKLHEPVKT
ncbi:L-aspartate oxidase [Halobacillus litoralis]|uniref:L-aspartate oxidase n=1 Tax=Halobacillus litoralis TaxID=45668 RepID=UPI001CFD930C|nr:L-aspartate oxidase [Halobacillus litoralis]